jgi:hypothetical protein
LTRQIARSGADTRPGFDRCSDVSGRNLADLAEKLLGQFSALRVVNLEGPFSGLDQRPSDAANPERRR